MARLFSIRPTWSLKGRRFQGLRGFTGKPFHPPLTDFPIVCYTLAAVFDLISFFSDEIDPKAHDFFVAATFVMVAGFIVSLGAALTGFMDWWKGIPRDRKSGPIGTAKHTQVWRTINWHATVMLTVTAITLDRHHPARLRLRPGADAGFVARALHPRGCSGDVRRRVRWDARLRVRLQRRERRGGLERVRGGPRPPSQGRRSFVSPDGC